MPTNSSLTTFFKEIIMITTIPINFIVTKDIDATLHPKIYPRYFQLLLQSGLPTGIITKGLEIHMKDIIIMTNRMLFDLLKRRV